MFRAVFADDEIIVREGIQRRVDWQQRGFVLAGVFSNGSQVAEHLKTHPDVDLVISDICMPEMDGLELSRYISRHHPKVCVLLLTGFDEFEYAKEAIKYNVKELLLKPITAKELEDVLDQTHAYLQEQHQRYSEQEQLKTKLRESMPILRERFLNRLTAGRIASSKIPEELLSYELPEQKAYSLCIIIDPLSPEGNTESNTFSDMHSLSISEACMRFLNSHDLLFFNKDEQLTAVLQQDTRKGLQRRGREVSRRLLELLHGRMGLAVTIALGRCFGSLDQVQASYKDAQKALAHQFTMGKNCIIAAEDLDFSPQGFADTRKDLEEALIHSLKTRPSEHSREILAGFFSRTFSDHLSLPFAQLQTQLLLSKIITFLEEAGISVMEVLGDPEDELTILQTRRSREEVEAWFYRFIDRIHEQITRKRLDPTQQKILQACRYIGDHFSEKQLGMQEICRELSISPSHFSAQFKLTTGKTFIEYLTAVRIQQASMLLKTTNLCSYEVADAVGYEDAHYFSQVFKKSTGMTVRDYRRMLDDTREEVL